MSLGTISVSRGAGRRRRTPVVVVVAIAAALIIALTAIGCGGKDTEINPNELRDADVVWGKPSGEEPTGVVILLHGGGWQPNKFAFEAEKPLAEELQSRGFATVILGYDEGAKGFRQVEEVYARARKRYPKLPVCAHGISAGGTFALMLAAKEPKLTCVATLIAPTDLASLEDQGSQKVHDLAVAAFGEDELDDYSPVRFADDIKAKTLLVFTQTDPVVPPEQGPEFVRARPQTELLMIPAGSTAVDWLHGAEVTPVGARTAVTAPFDFIAEAIDGA